MAAPTSTSADEHVATVCGGSPCCLDPAFNVSGGCPLTVGNSNVNTATSCGTGGFCASGAHKVCVTTSDCIGGGTCVEAVMYTNIVLGLCM